MQILKRNPQNSFSKKRRNILHKDIIVKHTQISKWNLLEAFPKVSLQKCYTRWSSCISRMKPCNLEMVKSVPDLKRSNQAEKDTLIGTTIACILMFLKDILEEFYTDRLIYGKLQYQKPKSRLSRAMNPSAKPYHCLITATLKKFYPCSFLVKPLVDKWWE